MQTNISPRHAEHLAAFRISPELLAAARIQSLTDSETRELLGINGQHPGRDLSGLAFPFFDPLTDARTGARVRIDAPITDDVPKYLMEFGCRHLFFAPGAAAFLNDTSVAVIFVEAEKSALALAALAARSRRRYLIVATGGADAWKRKCGKKQMPDGSSKTVTGPSPDLDLIYMKGRHSLVAFDSNVLTNPRVRKARVKFQKELVARGASVAFVEIPLEDNINGPDDYIRERGDDAMLEAIDSARGEAETLRKLRTNEQGKAKGSLANAITVLRDAPVWAGVLALNELSLATVTRRATPWGKTGIWSDVDDIRTADWLQRNGIEVNPRTAGEAVNAVAEENKFHPVREYLSALKWDGEKRIDAWLTKYLGVAGTEFARAVGARWLISGVARIFEPGCQADYTLLLVGDQGIQKSKALRTLAVRDEWFTDHISDLRNKDARVELLGKWIIELSELASVRRSDMESVKSFLTAVIDHFRPPYGRRAIDAPRMNVFAASVNEETPLEDETGGRRFWPVDCGAIDVAALERDRDQLWAEAVVRYKAGDPWWLETAELNALASEEQDDRYEEGPWDDVILAWLKSPEQRSEPNGVPITPFDSSRDAVTATDILIHAVGKDVKNISRNDRIQVVRCLRHNSWRRIRKRAVRHVSSDGKGEKCEPGFYVRVKK